MTPLSLTINGRPVNAEVEPRTHLADFIRETQNLTGTHLGCEHGVCGACTVLVDGVPVRSCITYAVACSGASVTTIEGLDDDEIGAELRAAFSREHALQCGYCTPGMLMSAAISSCARTLDEQDIRVAMSGNLCRCTGYVGIVGRSRASSRIGGPEASRRFREQGARRSGRRAPAMDRAPARRCRRRRSRRRAGRGAGRGCCGRERPADCTPQASFDQSFVVNHPVAEVWNFFANAPRSPRAFPALR